MVTDWWVSDFGVPRLFVGDLTGGPMRCDWLADSERMRWCVPSPGLRLALQVEHLEVSETLRRCGLRGELGRSDEG